MSHPPTIDHRTRIWVITAALMALFLGAMDAMIMSAAMPTVIADLGGLGIYSWVYSAYFLARAVSLPIFGKLADLFRAKVVFLISLAIFLISSVWAGFAQSMGVLIAARVLQGIGAGGNFALVYIVLADMAPPGKRAKTLSMASAVWGISSVLGPTLGGLIVSRFSWRWIFFINIPFCLFSMVLIGLYLIEIREKRQRVSLDIAGVVTLSTAVLGFLTLMMVGGKDLPWGSPTILALAGVTLAAGIAFYRIETRAPDPILNLRFFNREGFTTGNGSTFLSSFAIFSLFAYAPLFIQGALGRSPMEVGIAMLSLSLGWSLGSLAMGQVLDRIGRRKVAMLGGLCLFIGAGLTLLFTRQTTMMTCFWVFMLVGLGMGFVTLATLLVVQSTVKPADLGVATSTHQFARTLGGTMGVGVSGGFLSSGMAELVRHIDPKILTPSHAPGAETGGMLSQVDRIFQPDVQAALPEQTRIILQGVVADSMTAVFWIIVAASALCMLCCAALPRKERISTG